MDYRNFYNLLNFRHRGFIKKSVKYYCLENNNKLNPWYVTGFVDGEGCFNINITKSSSNLIGYQVQARFIIEIHIKDIEILRKIQAFFDGIGSITSDATQKKCCKIFSLWH